MEMLSKNLIFGELERALELRYTTAKKAAQQAKDAATNEESVAETKYDTFGLEASYLAHGQSERVHQCEKEWFDFKRFLETEQANGGQHLEVNLWSLVHLQACDDDSLENYFLLSNIAGGLQISVFDQEKPIGKLVLISPTTPVGQKLLNKVEGDTVMIPKAGQQIEFEIVDIK